MALCVTKMSNSRANYYSVNDLLSFLLLWNIFPVLTFVTDANVEGLPFSLQLLYLCLYYGVSLHFLF